MLWKLIAWFCSRQVIATWLIARAMRTPYTHITSADGEDVYMGRYWLFNPYPANTSGSDRPKWQFPISIRIHYICRPDSDRDLHDHPWNARSTILRGWYVEERFDDNPFAYTTEKIGRVRGDTFTLNHGEYHRIAVVSPGGVWTMFITGRYRGTWGFLVNGLKVNWRTYLGLDK